MSARQLAAFRRRCRQYQPGPVVRFAVGLGVLFAIYVCSSAIIGLVGGVL